MISSTLGLNCQILLLGTVYMSDWSIVMCLGSDSDGHGECVWESVQDLDLFQADRGQGRGELNWSSEL